MCLHEMSGRGGVLANWGHFWKLVSIICQVKVNVSLAYNNLGEHATWTGCDA